MAPWILKSIVQPPFLKILIWIIIQIIRRDIIDDPQIDLIYIASNHYTHAEYAIEALNKGKSVHIEKPHVVNESQLDRLIACYEKI